MLNLNEAGFIQFLFFYLEPITKTFILAFEFRPHYFINADHSSKACRQVEKVALGQQVTLTTTVTNTSNETMPFIVLFEQRDARGFTLWLSYLQTTAPANSQTESGVSYRIEHLGRHELRVTTSWCLSNCKPGVGIRFDHYVCDTSEVASGCRL